MRVRIRVVAIDLIYDHFAELVTSRIHYVTF